MDPAAYEQEVIRYLMYWDYDPERDHDYAEEEPAMDVETAQAIIKN